jgi:endonuclease/exonuclease/phosphatase family metal-dependent hydrolase
VRVTDVHLGAGIDHDERTRQAHALLDQSRGVSVIAGDLNGEPASDELAVFAAAGWADAETRHRDEGMRRPATNWAPGPRTAAPTQRLDYLLVQETTAVLDAFVPDDWARWAVLSDHLPVVARLEV